MLCHAIALTLFLPLTLGIKGFGTIPDSTKLDCSADSSTATPDAFALTREWNSEMFGCLEQMSNSDWNGAKCTPPNSPAFGFYKGNENMKDGQQCFGLCEKCLADGINNGRAVTTVCKYTSYIGWGPAVGWTCDMGFKWGG